MTANQTMKNLRPDAMMNPRPDAMMNPRVDAKLNPLPNPTKNLATEQWFR